MTVICFDLPINKALAPTLNGFRSSLCQRRVNKANDTCRGIARRAQAKDRNSEEGVQILPRAETDGRIGEFREDEFLQAAGGHRSGDPIAIIHFRPLRARFSSRPSIQARTLERR